MGFEVWGLGFRSLGFGVQGLVGFGVRGLGLACSDTWRVGLGAWGLEFLRLGGGGGSFKLI